MTAAKVERTEAPATRGARVEVNEPGIRAWTGTVSSVKWSPVSGWWLDIERDDGDLTYIIPAEAVTLLPDDEKGESDDCTTG